MVYMGCKLGNFEMARKLLNRVGSLTEREILVYRERREGRSDSEVSGDAIVSHTVSR
jgi:hypothetical protein